MTGPRAILWNTRYTLDDVDKARVIWAAKKRYDWNRRVNAQYDDFTGRPPMAQEIDSVGAELAFARMAWLKPRLVLTQWQGAANCFMPDGRSVNVTHTRMNPPLLLEGYNAKRFCAFYILVTGAFPRFRYRGWARFCELIHHSTVRQFQTLCYSLKHYQVRRDLVILAQEEEE